MQENNLNNKGRQNTSPPKKIYGKSVIDRKRELESIKNREIKKAPDSNQPNQPKEAATVEKDNSSEAVLNDDKDQGIKKADNKEIKRETAAPGDAKKTKQLSNIHADRQNPVGVYLKKKLALLVRYFYAIKQRGVRSKTSRGTEGGGFTAVINSDGATKLFICLLSLVILIMAASLLYIYRPFPINDGIPSEVTMYYVFNGNKEFKNVSGKKVFRDNGEIYVNLTEIYSHFGMSVIGDLNEMKYSLASGEYMVVKNRSDHVDMNGETVTLPGRVYIEGQQVYVPVALFDYYTEGSDISYNTELERLTVSRKIDTEKTNSIQTVYFDFDFVVNKCSPIDPIPEQLN